MTHKNPWQCKVMAWRLEDISIWKKTFKENSKMKRMYESKIPAPSI